MFIVLSTSCWVCRANMGRKYCVICKSTNKNIDLSFHAFPKSENRKNAWTETVRKGVTKILFRNLIHMFAQPIFLSIAGHKMAAWNCQLFRPWLSSFLIIFLFQWASLNRTWKSFTRLNSENNLEKRTNRVGGRWLFPKMYPWIYENKYSNCIIRH